LHKATTFEEKWRK